MVVAVIVQDSKVGERAPFPDSEKDFPLKPQIAAKVRLLVMEVIQSRRVVQGKMNDQNL